MRIGDGSRSCREVLLIEHPQSLQAACFDQLSRAAQLWHSCAPAGDHGYYYNSDETVNNGRATS